MRSCAIAYDAATFLPFFLSHLVLTDRRPLQDLMYAASADTQLGRPCANLNKLVFIL